MSTTSCSRETASPIRASRSTAAQLKKQGIKDFQLDYALHTLARLRGAGDDRVAGATPKKSR